MKCSANKDNYYNYTWIKKNSALPSRAQRVDSSHLIIVNLRPEDSGDYQCVVSNSTGTINSDFFAVHVKGKVRRLQ